RFEGRSDWLPIAAWANVEMCIDGDTVEIIIPCVASRDGCIEPLIIAGTITSVCMAFPAISAVAEGYKVFAVIDASGTYSKMAQE
ncbi:isochorismatase family protein, partial [Salmonella enterica subsp. enterica serovar Kentucky]|nr:isochorismatase family protein [Salmonella enterica subsp. enterica serovar Kentucky]